MSELLAAAVACRNHIWDTRQDLDEDSRIDLLLAECTRLCGGDANRGDALTTEAIWS